MAAKKYSEEQIQKALSEIDAGATVAATARAHGISIQTLNRRRTRAVTTLVELDELRALQAENQRLKRIVARQALEIDAYRETTDGAW
jgi:putative transposase